ncbi:hypothetical protein DQ04_18741010 [Trypanosoma grayi]|uniref:hypothetical protein n=1 Tax=Trypanosoma grayi TaxID=71804 RepID=UPI0004F4770F|nr:hypothetical protein DQ04_18741010 [Trypanosoma grayi]KEG05751.1 hypothetical protein DQ04_18741010 [Trypanosoma grayi]
MRRPRRNAARSTKREIRLRKRRPFRPFLLKCAAPGGTQRVRRTRFEAPSPPGVSQGNAGHRMAFPHGSPGCPKGRGSFQEGFRETNGPFPLKGVLANAVATIQTSTQKPCVAAPGANGVAKARVDPHGVGAKRVSL